MESNQKRLMEQVRYGSVGDLGGDVGKQTWQGRGMLSKGMNVTAGVACSHGKGSAPEQREQLLRAQEKGPGEKDWEEMQGQQADDPWPGRGGHPG